MPGSVYRLAEGLQAPYTLQGVFSVERQLPGNMTVAASYINIRTLHVLRTRPLNAPLPGTFIPGVPESGVRPLNCADFIPPDINPSTRCNIFEYESSGRYNQNQFIVNVNSRFHRNVTLHFLLRLRQSEQRHRRHRKFSGQSVRPEHGVWTSVGRYQASFCDDW